jgi:hypothetical protein
MPVIDTVTDSPANAKFVVFETVITRGDSAFAAVVTAPVAISATVLTLITSFFNDLFMTSHFYLL